MPNKNLTMSDLGILSEFDSLALTSTTPFHSVSWWSLYCQQYLARCQVVGCTSRLRRENVRVEEVISCEGTDRDMMEQMMTCDGTDPCKLEQNLAC